MGGPKVAVGAVMVTILIAVLFTVVLVGNRDDRCAPTTDSPAGDGGVPAGELSKPLKTGDYQVSSTYKSADRPGHRGIDLAAPAGTPMYAAAPGVVSQAGPASGFGNWIVIDHEIGGRTISTVYGHMYADGVEVQAGDTVKAGQRIGKVGSAGQSTGPHLHFEVWEGSRQSGTETDPGPWIDKAVDPGGGGAAPTSRPATPSPKDAQRVSSGELPPSEKIVNADKLQRDSVRLARSIAQKFPGVHTIGGWRPTDPYPDHPSGRAVDIMIPDYDTGEGKKLGDEITDYVVRNKSQFNVDYLIWRQQYIPAEGAPTTMEDRGSPTQNHLDHVHVTVAGGGLPSPGQTFGPAPDSAGPGAGSSAGTCTPAGVGESGRSIDSGRIPPELIKWIQLGGRVCREVDAPLLAGLLYHESAGFQAQAVSPVGAQGYGQFMPGTWASKGAKVDENGRVAGPPGSGSPSDPADATMAAARYLCEIAEGQRAGLVSGQLKGDPQSLMLAGYNAGPGAVQQYGGVPPFAETQKYVVIVPEKAQQFVETVR